MYCPACGAANTEGAKFCGACGAKIGEAARAATADPGRAATAEPVGAAEPSAPGSTTPTVSLPAQAAAPGPSSVRSSAAARRGPPPRVEASLGSLVPARSGGRAAKIALVLLIDVGLAAGGVVLATRPKAAATASAGAGPGAGTGTGSGAGSVAGSGTGSGSVAGVGSGGGTAGGNPGGGNNNGGGGGGGTTGSGSGRTSVPVPATGTLDAGSGTPSPGGIDARSLDWSMDPIDAAAARPIDAAGAPTVDPIDAAVAPDPDPDPDVEPDPGDEPPDDTDAGPDDAEVGADDIAREFNRFISTSQSKLNRCYQSATKGLPDDQPLSGEVDIELGVMPTGQSQNVRVTQNTTGSEALARCLIGIVNAWSFSRHDGSGAIQLVRKFSFSPQ